MTPQPHDPEALFASIVQHLEGVASRLGRSGSSIVCEALIQWLGQEIKIYERAMANLEGMAQEPAEMGKVLNWPASTKEPVIRGNLL